MAYDINEIMETYQDLVDNNILTLEAAQYMFDDHINDIILEAKKDIDDAFNEGLISAYEKNICYINIGIDVDVNYEKVISNLIESELSLIEEKKVDPNNIPSKEEYYKQLAEKQAKKEKRKAFFKKVGGAAVAAGAIAGGAYLANKASVASNDRKVVRPDNPEYAELFKNRDDELNDLTKKYKKAIKAAKTDVEKDDIDKQYKINIARVKGKFDKEVSDYKFKKRNLYEQNKAKEQAAYDKAVANETDPRKLADYEKHHKETMDKWDVDKENKRKMEQFDRSDYYRRAELNREDPDNFGRIKRALLRKRQEKKMSKINKKYDAYNAKNVK